jgi:hypothetical protein
MEREAEGWEGERGVVEGRVEMVWGKNKELEKGGGGNSPFSWQPAEWGVGTWGNQTSEEFSPNISLCFLLFYNCGKRGRKYTKLSKYGWLSFNPSVANPETTFQISRIQIQA